VTRVTEVVARGQILMLVSRGEEEATPWPAAGTSTQIAEPDQPGGTWANGGLRMISAGD
jgi:hypothetical protein